MKLWQLDSAIAELCIDVERVVEHKDYTCMSEQDLTFELLICILGSGVRYELSLAYANAVQSILDQRISIKCVNSNLLENSIQDVLNAPTYSSLNNKTYSRYRYPKRAARYIAESLCNIYRKYGTIKNMTEVMATPSDLRRELISLCPGIGPKQSSHYVKNIGLTDNVAILDRHILNYLKLIDEIDICPKQVNRIENYEELERRFINRASKFNHAVSVVDQAMWFVMRALGKEAYT
jgi:N-glycosylase/DNA lyase